MRRFNWKKAGAWLCTLTLLTGMTSVSASGLTGPGEILSTVAETVSAVLAGPGAGMASPSDAVFPARSAGVPEKGTATASASNATSSDASQFDEEGVLIDGIALIDDISTPSDAAMGLRVLTRELPLAKGMDPDMAKLFDALAAACDAWDGGSEITVDGLLDCGIRAEDADDYYEVFVNAYPEFFFLRHQMPEWTADAEEHLETMTIFTLSDEVSPDDRAVFESKVDEIVQGIPAGADWQLSALYLHDWICDNCEYYSWLDDEYADYNRLAYSAYGPLLGGSASCQGYALGYQCLLNAAGVQAHVVWAGDHSWNLVNAGTEESPDWLYADCTQDDPGMAYSSYFDHAFFLKTSAQLLARTYVYGSRDSWVLDLGGPVTGCAEITEGAERTGSFWENAIGIIRAIGSKWFYADSKEQETIDASGDGYLRVRYYDASDGTEGVLSGDTIPGRWMSGDTYFYDVAYAHFSVYDGSLYVSSEDGVWKLAPDGSEVRKIYTLTDEEKENGSIYGIWPDEDNPEFLYYEVYAGPSSTYAYVRKRLDLANESPVSGVSFTLDQRDFEIIVGDEGVTVTAVVPDEGEPEIRKGMLKWRLERGAGFVSLRVSEDGASAVITPLCGGGGYLNVSSETYSQSLYFDVYDKVERIILKDDADIEITEPIALEINSVDPAEKNIKVDRLPDTARYLEEITWSSSDDEVSVVAGSYNNAKITAKGAGEATVTASTSLGDVSCKVQVTKTAVPSSLTALSVDGTEIADLTKADYSGWDYDSQSGWFYDVDNDTGAGLLVLSGTTVETITAAGDLAIGVAGVDEIGTVTTDGALAFIGLGIAVVDQLTAPGGLSTGNTALFLKDENGITKTMAEDEFGSLSLVEGTDFWKLVGDSILKDYDYVLPSGKIFMVPENSTLKLEAGASADTTLTVPEDSVLLFDAMAELIVGSRKLSDTQVARARLNLEESMAFNGSAVNEGIINISGHGRIVSDMGEGYISSAASSSSGTVQPRGRIEIASDAEQHFYASGLTIQFLGLRDTADGETTSRVMDSHPPSCPLK